MTALHDPTALPTAALASGVATMCGMMADTMIGSCVAASKRYNEGGVAFGAGLARPTLHFSGDIHGLDRPDRPSRPRQHARWPG
jgi:hypothetical protein